MTPSTKHLLEDEDDAPPPLSSLQGQLEAAQARPQVKATPLTATTATTDPQSTLRIASIVVSSDSSQGQKDQQATTPKPALKKGFFDAKPAGRRPAAGKIQGAANASTSSTQQDAIPLLKGNKEMLAPGAKAIPDFMRIDPGEEQKRYNQFKSELLEAVKPTRETVDNVAKDPMLVSGFDDPEIMAAVDEIARDPSSMKKYQHNKKVMAFYSALGKAVGLDQKLENMAATAVQKHK